MKELKIKKKRTKHLNISITHEKNLEKIEIFANEFQQLIENNFYPFFLDEMGFSDNLIPNYAYQYMGKEARYLRKNKRFFNKY